MIRAGAARFPDEAVQFVREGLAHTVKVTHGKDLPKVIDPADESRHVSGQQLCIGLRDVAVERYGMLARTVLGYWGIQRTVDFGTIVYGLIDKGELRGSSRDSLEHFRDVYDFDEAFQGSV
ncbi:MAG: hypothetical protein H7Y88_09050 [Phycisphaerales bacterium]|nr:hypothetical protein [Phycisphaerales bacterium]